MGAIEVDRVTRRRRRGWIVGCVALAGVVVGAAFAFFLTRPGPVLLDPDDFPGVERSAQDVNDTPPGWTGCNLSVGGWVRDGAPDTTLIFGPRERVGAAIAVAPGPRQPDAVEKIETLRTLAKICADSEMTERGFSIEPLTGLDADAVGWRTREEGYVWRVQEGDEWRDHEGYMWGEYVVIPLDERRLLAVGFQTDQEEPPVDMDRLVELARQGAEQFPAEE